MHWGGTGGRGPGTRNDVFEHREGGERRVVPNQALATPIAVPLTPPPILKTRRSEVENTGSSLDFIKPAREIADKVLPPIATPVAVPAPEKKITAAPAPKAVAKPSPKGKKSFATPKLQPSRGFTKMGGSKNVEPVGSNPPPSGVNEADLLKNLPPEAANNPQLQQYLKQQQGQ